MLYLVYSGWLDGQLNMVVDIVLGVGLNRDLIPSIVSKDCDVIPTKEIVRGIDE